MLRQLCGLAFLLIALSGCASRNLDVRGLDPIPPRLVAEMKARGMTPADPIFIRIHKQESELELWKRDRTGKFALLKTYPLCRWSGKLGPKMAEGDRQAPEGFYTVTSAMLNPRSKFNLSFDLGFPNRLESALGWKGTALMVHGACSSSGCYAMTDHGVEEVYAVVRDALAAGQDGFQVQALPFRMTPQNLSRHRADPNMPFWRNLKEGSDRFDILRQPPVVRACGRRYVFNAPPDGELDPLGRCPAFGAEAETADRLAAISLRDEAALNSPSAEAARSYVDGGMHPSFRQILATSGAKRLEKMTSSDVPVSRPEAALADPYRSQAVATGR
ncbi:murein L,D-transpeptidase family protein [Terrihabitans rhizophilus]|uniref:Murein L,D-transpeptidase family protein n=1 Tax=Terrihabitans rhizophilus TaxID=3092662 RepID=A0ABU4RIG9_9HYPH|nr:murein L,D-transpeptidase family protein [Terrihabitans sp. PJ23]MDX6804629.1 murein L,D-transpeptidase family protein [Terrihabitans sp. PJ23]